MAKSKEPFNPFYALVLLLGAAFCVTTLAYATMAYRAADPVAAEIDKASLMGLVDRYGVQTLLGELALLGVATFGAMWLDGVRTRRAEQESETPEWKDTR